MRVASASSLVTYEPVRVMREDGSIDPARDAQAMEDEVILADLGVAERRLERIDKDLKKGRSAEMEAERELLRFSSQNATGHGKIPWGIIAGSPNDTAASASSSSPIGWRLPAARRSRSIGSSCPRSFLPRVAVGSTDCCMMHCTAPRSSR